MEVVNVDSDSDDDKSKKRAAAPGDKRKYTTGNDDNEAVRRNQPRHLSMSNNNRVQEGGPQNDPMVMARQKAVGDIVSIDAVRIGVGKKVFRSKCKLSIQFGTNNPYIKFSYENKKGKLHEHDVFVKGEELTEVKYHIPDENDTGEDGDSDSMTMIAFRINPSESNGFDKYSSSYSQENNDDPDKFHKQYISVEVRDTDDFRVSM